LNNDDADGDDEYEGAVDKSGKVYDNFTIDLL